MSLATRLSDLAYAIGTDMKALRVLITGTPTGTVDSLTTTTKASVIDAINEVNAKPASDITQGDLDNLKSEILGAGVPAALDTLDELAAALGDDANFAATVTTALGNRVLSADVGNPDTDLVALYTAAKA